MKPKRVPFTVIATMLFLVVWFNSTPSDTAIPDPTRIPNSLPESQDLRDLANWVVRSRTTERPERVVTSHDLDAALTRQPQTMSLLEAPAIDITLAARREALVSLPYGSEIWRISQRRGVDGLLVAAIVEAESGFAADVISPRGAVGLMQVLPSTGEHYGIANLHEPSANLDAGCRYLGQLLRDFEGDPEQAVAAYNAGPATVARYGGVPPFRETKAYVKKVMTLYRERSDRVLERSGAGRDPFAALTRVDS